MAALGLETARAITVSWASAPGGMTHVAPFAEMVPPAAAEMDSWDPVGAETPAQPGVKLIAITIARVHITGIRMGSPG